MKKGKLLVDINEGKTKQKAGKERRECEEGRKKEQRRRSERKQ